MSDTADRISILEIGLDEQRKDAEVLQSFYNQAKVKNITFLAAALGLLGYLYTNTDKTGLKDKLFIPDEPYGVIIYAIGLLMFLGAITLLMIALKPMDWSTAFENSREPRDETYEEHLKYLRGRYITISTSNAKSYNRKVTLLEISFIPLLLGGTILILLKTFGG